MSLAVAGSMRASAPAAGSLVRRLPVPAELDVARTLSVLRHGPADPTTVRAPDGAYWRTARTPDGPVSLRLVSRPLERLVVAQAWGSGAAWQLAQLPQLLGNADTRASFVPGLAMLERLHRRFAGWRLTRPGLVFESLLPAVLEQKVTNGQAFSAYAQLLRRYGEPAPGPGERLGLITPPPAQTWRQVPVWVWHRAGVGPLRRDTVRRVAGRAAALEAAGALGSAALDAALRAVSGVGVWTSAEVRQRALADADAVSVGDAHLCHTVGHALTGRRTDDAGMLELLARWPGHRYRVTQLLVLGGYRAPAFGPRYSPHDFRDM